MKRFKFTALVMAMFSISLAVTGCGGSDDGGQPGRPGGIAGAGLLPGQIVPGGGVVTPGGGLSISFSGTNVYNSGMMISGGPAQYWDGYQYSSTFTGYFVDANNIGRSISQTFSNQTMRLNPCTQQYITPANTTLITGTGSVAYTSGIQTYTGNSFYEAGATISVASSSPACSLASLSGVVTVPPNFIARNPRAFPQGASTPIIGMAIDLGISGGNQYASSLTGGVLIYTSGSGNDLHGAFLKF